MHEETAHVVRVQGHPGALVHQRDAESKGDRHVRLHGRQVRLNAKTVKGQIGHTDVDADRVVARVDVLASASTRSDGEGRVELGRADPRRAGVHDCEGDRVTCGSCGQSTDGIGIDPITGPLPLITAISRAVRQGRGDDHILGIPVPGVPIGHNVGHRLVGGKEARLVPLTHLSYGEVRQRVDRGLSCTFQEIPLGICQLGCESQDRAVWK